MEELKYYTIHTIYIHTHTHTETMLDWPCSLREIK